MADDVDGCLTRWCADYAPAARDRADVVARFERSLAAMPEHVPEIRSWSLSRVEPRGRRQAGPTCGSGEFTELDGLHESHLRGSVVRPGIPGRSWTRWSRI